MGRPGLLGEFLTQLSSNTFTLKLFKSMRMSVAKCRGSWVVGKGRGSWVWVWVNVVGKNKPPKKIGNLFLKEINGFMLNVTD